MEELVRDISTTVILDSLNGSEIIQDYKRENLLFNYKPVILLIGEHCCGKTSFIQKLWPDLDIPYGNTHDLKIYNTVNYTIVEPVGLGQNTLKYTSKQAFHSLLSFIYFVDISAVLFFKKTGPTTDIDLLICGLIQNLNKKIKILTIFTYYDDYLDPLVPAGYFADLKSIKQIGTNYTFISIPSKLDLEYSFMINEIEESVFRVQSLLVDMELISNYKAISTLIRLKTVALSFVEIFQNKDPLEIQASNLFCANLHGSIFTIRGMVSNETQRGLFALNAIKFINIL